MGSVREALERKAELQRARELEQAKQGELEAENRRLADEAKTAQQNAVLFSPSDDLPRDAEFCTADMLTGYSADDWKTAAGIGKFNFESDYCMVNSIPVPNEQEYSLLARFLISQRGKNGAPLDPRSGNSWRLAFERLKAAGIIRPEPLKEKPTPVAEVVPSPGTRAYEQYDRQQYLRERVAEQYAMLKRLEEDGVNVQQVFRDAIQEIEASLGGAKLPDNSQRLLMDAWCKRGNLKFSVPALVAVGSSLFPPFRFGGR